MDLANYPAWEVFSSLSGQVRTAGMGGFVAFDYAALPMILEAHDIPRSEWRFMLDKVQVLATIARQHWNKPTGSKEP